MAGIPRPVHADQSGREWRGHETRGHEFREHEFRREEFRDSRYHHDHYYPPRGYRFSALPAHPRLVVYGGQRFYFSGGVWYRPTQNVFVVVRPPVGNGAPPVAATPAPGVSAAPPATVAQGGGSQLFIYPRQGQTVDQQNRDRNKCNRWAISQTGRDPTANGGRMDADFQRAFGACLDGRGYTVK